MIGLEGELAKYLIEAGVVFVALAVLLATVWFIIRPLIIVVVNSTKDAEAKLEELIELRRETQKQLQINHLQINTVSAQIEANNRAIEGFKIVEEATQMRVGEVRKDIEAAIKLLVDHISKVSEAATQEIVESFPSALEPIVVRLQALERIEKRADQLASETSLMRESLVEIKRTLIDSLVNALVSKSAKFDQSANQSAPQETQSLLNQTQI